MLDDAKIAFLDDLLARTDALFLPPRVWANPATCLPNAAWAALEEGRHGFFRTGLSVPFSGDSAARKTGERLVESLEADRLVQIYRRNGRRAGLRLTRHGDDVARWFGATNQLIDSWVWLLRLESLIAGAVCHAGGRLVREDDLAAVDYGTNEAVQALRNLENNLLPLAAAGLVDDTCDMKGHVWYLLTKRGVAAIAKGCPMPLAMPEFRPGYGVMHCELLERFLAERLTAQGSPGHVVVPWPARFSPTRSWHDVVNEIPLIIDIHEPA